MWVSHLVQSEFVSRLGEKRVMVWRAGTRMTLVRYGLFVSSRSLDQKKEFKTNRRVRVKLSPSWLTHVHICQHLTATLLVSFLSLDNAFIVKMKSATMND